MADTLATVTGKIRAKLGDLDAQLYDDAFLLTYVGMAQSELDGWLRSKGVERYRLDTTLTVPAGTTVLSATSTPALPSDFHQPITMHERPSGSTNVADWVPVTLIREDLPLSAQPGETLGVWCWQQGTIRFVGALTDRQVSIDYLTVPAEVALPTDVLPMSDSAEAVSALAAEKACRSAGASQAAAEFRAEYLAARDVLYSTAMRLKQRRVLRRKFYYPGRFVRAPYIT